ncbi:FIST signal transduction protein [Rhodoferax sp. UBA5149]|uniref:FIST signal transduction protein n=1 Tax=Rhodoferax sp. UBA5149 TaxID=1947379 RepID=UPI0025D8021C|nr:FIST N-terminal domain-containing protein [Rhodoferax sp. UBA5149]
MRAKSASTTITDPYRAALFLGQSLAEISPEVVFLFVTVHYSDWHEFMDGLYDGLDNPRVRVIGASGDGVHETSRSADVGAAALGLGSDGAVQWHIESSDGVEADPEGAVRRVLSKLAGRLAGRKPAFYFLLSNFKTDASRIETVVRDEVDVPVVGGMAGDDNDKMERCCVFLDRAVVQDSLVMLAVDGPLAFQIHIGNAVSPVGAPGAIDVADGKTLHRIGGLDATAFVERETGKPFLRSDQGIVTLNILNSGNAGEKKLRAVAQDFGTESGSLNLHGGIRAGELVQVCVARPEDLVAEVDAIAARARASGFHPCAALIISCAGRKWLLGGQIEFEVRAVVDAFHGTLPVAGFPSFGEIGPLFHEGRYTRNLFHNMTYVLLLLGHCHEP